MLHPKRSLKTIGNRKGSRQQPQISLENLILYALGAIAACLLVAVWLVNSSSNFGSSTTVRTPKVRRKKLIPSFGNIHNAVAMDIINTLECEKEEEEKDSANNNKEEEKVEKDTDTSANSNNVESRRLLEENISNVDPGEGGDHSGDLNGGGGYGFYGMGVDDLYGQFPVYVNGRDLFCLVAGAEKFTERFEKVKHEQLECDAIGSKREALLNVWSSVRSQMPIDMIKKVLDISVETQHALTEDPLKYGYQHIWKPLQDNTVEYYVLSLSETNSTKGLALLENKGGLYVEVGSGLGISTLAVSLMYPDASVLSIEPAMPSWLLQRMNLVCNLPSGSKIPQSILSGVGPKHDGMNKMMWRPASTGTTRAWTPKTERTDEDIELVVRLRTLRSIIAEATADEEMESEDRPPMVLNMDCEGCEYNVIPAMTDREFDSFGTIIGTTGVHWGYIPEDKRPSSKRGRETHKKLCSHFNFASTSIECCEFPRLKVNGRENDRVEEVNGGLCDKFESWAIDKGLYTSTDDFGWSDLTSMA